MDLRHQLTRLNTKDIQYYFDGNCQGHTQRGLLYTRHLQWLALREKLSRLPKSSYESTLKAIEALVETAYGEMKQSEEEASHQASHTEGEELFRQTKRQGAKTETAPTASIKPIESV